MGGTSDMRAVLEGMWDSGYSRVTGNSEAYVDYVTKRDLVGHPHLNVLREASGLACIDPPEIFYELHIDPELRDPKAKKKKFMSKPQLEAVAYACQSHLHFFEAQYVEIPIDPVPKCKSKPLNTDESIEEEDQSESTCEGESEDSDSDEFIEEEDPFDFVHESETEDLDNAASNEQEDPIDPPQNGELGDSFEPMEVDEEVKMMDYRRGFFLGDGTGTGKTRILAGVVYEYFVGGGRKCLWVTVNRGLFSNAIENISYLLRGVNVTFWKGLKDLVDLSASPDKLQVLLVTYRKLVKPVNAVKLEKWLGDDFEGLMLFDEAHLAKACIPKKSSTAGRRVLRLQYKYPKARVVYSTATAASDVTHLLLFTRLHLWGKDTEYGDAADFREAVCARELPGLELIALEMKMAGVFLSRQISFKGVKVVMEEVRISEGIRFVYIRATQLFSLLLEYQARLKPVYKEIFKYDKAKLQKVAAHVAALYMACQTFFGLLITSSKIPKMHQLARKELAANKTIVIGLQRTGEKKLDAFTDKETTWNLGKPFSNAMCVLRTAMLNLGIPIGCPRTYLTDGREIKVGEWSDFDCPRADQFASDMWDGVKLSEEELAPTEELLLVDNFEDIPTLKKWPAYSFGSFLDHPDLTSPEHISWSYEEVSQNPSLEGYARLYHELSLFLPINPLDEIRHRFECRVNPDDAYYVSELTGRRTQYDYNMVERQWELKPKESSLENEIDLLNHARKRVAVLSSSASTGFDLHAGKSKDNKQQRYHITLEIGWAPEQFLQQLGRTHRTGQTFPPEYCVLKSPIPGEERFMSMMGRRLRYLGSSSTGHSESNPHAGYLKDDFFSVGAIHAINRTLAAVPSMPEHRRIQRLLSTLEVTPIQVRVEGTYVPKATRDRIKKFLNRFMMLPCDVQDVLAKRIEVEIAKDINTGYIYKSLKMLPANLEDVVLAESCELEWTGVASRMYRFEIDRVAHWDYVEKVKAEYPTISFFNISEVFEERIVAVYETLDTRKLFVICPYNRNPERLCHEFLSEQIQREDAPWIEVGIEDAEMQWKREVDAMKGDANKGGRVTCEHMRGGGTCTLPYTRRKCTFRWAKTECILITGHLSGYAKVLEAKFIPVQLGKISFMEGGVRRELVGLLACYENCADEITVLYEHLQLYNPLF